MEVKAILESKMNLNQRTTINSSVDYSKENNTNPSFEVADIFRAHEKEYRILHNLPPESHKVINAIINCRTESMGCHSEMCDECGHVEIMYNSCRNRHCPKCQGTARLLWFEKRQRDVLPVEYYHVVFTLPIELEPIALRNKSLLYTILFKAASETLTELAGDENYLGAQIGFIAVLHTWTQTLLHHPHIHCIIPGGGLSPDNKEWVSCSNGFFLPVRVMSRLFRGKFLYYLKKAYEDGEIQFVGTIEDLEEKVAFNQLLSALYQKEWVVYCKPPFGSAELVLKYISNYVHRVAISNFRILHVENDLVTFKYRDSKDGNKQKVMTLSGCEFMRRFLLHVLPSGFMKIRYYGILSNRSRCTKLVTCKLLLLIENKKEEGKSITLDYSICPVCKKGSLKPMSYYKMIDERNEFRKLWEKVIA